ncbi:MAG: hypothetical protein D5S00_10380 [Tindallia sp. MSAO_Bac2]|nr:MAG: hypothetical protein D5S00_10380 [Tindallia sp. MSAO_Bac2]
MNIEVDSLIPLDTVYSDPDHIFAIVEKNGKVLLLRDNRPEYVILKYDDQIKEEKSMHGKKASYTLHEAMKIVLSNVENKTMHASELADEIYHRKLYLQKNGNKAQYTQIRARCGRYPDLFEALPGNYIKLKEDNV